MDYKEKNIAAYNKHVDFFAQKYTRNTNLLVRDEFELFLKELRGDKVLDLGCGPGTHSEYFKQKGKDVTAVDLSEEMIKICQAKGLNTIQADIEDLPFDQNSFDGIWMVSSLLHVPKEKWTNIFTKLSEILTEDGILYVAMKEGEDSKVTTKDSEGTERFFQFTSETELVQFGEKQFNIIFSRIIPAKPTNFVQVLARKK